VAARFALLCALLAAGCGPVGATAVIADAEIALARANAAEGEKHATYETTAAVLYLAKAREEQGRARYSSAMDLAKKSAQHAEAAARKSTEAKKNAAAPPPAPPATIERADGGTP